MNIEQLTEILKEHQLWLDTEGESGNRADLSRTNLSRVNLSGANLENAILARANLFGTNLSGATLAWAKLIGANLQKANLKGTNLQGAFLDDIQNKLIITFQAGRHFAYYCDKYVKIGCKTHTLTDWLENYKKIGKEAEYTSLEIELYGKFIQMCATLQLNPRDGSS